MILGGLTTRTKRTGNRCTQGSPQCSPALVGAGSDIGIIMAETFFERHKECHRNNENDRHHNDRRRSGARD